MSTQLDGITLAQSALLLAYAAAYDQRTIGDADVEAWYDIAADHRWTYDAARRAIREHYGQGANRPRLEAPAITDRIRAVRRQADLTFELPRIPDDLANADYPEWLRARRDEHVGALVHAWAHSGQEPPAQLPPAPPPNQIGQRRLAELTAGAFRDVPSAADVTGKPPTVDGMQARSAALAVACPYCGARPVEPCTRASAGGRVPITRLHPARTDHSSTSQEAS